MRAPRENSRQVAINLNAAEWARLEARAQLEGRSIDEMMHKLQQRGHHYSETSGEFANRKKGGDRGHQRRIARNGAKMNGNGEQDPLPGTEPECTIVRVRGPNWTVNLVLLDGVCIAAEPPLRKLLGKREEDLRAVFKADGLKATILVRAGKSHG